MKLYLICVLTVVWFTGDKMHIEDRPLEGKVLQQTSTQILGDFSGDAKRKDYYGDYSRVVVYKSHCRRD